ncbi:MAG: hypothetical protein QOD06_1935 [Candidatus Binatota bacterium]|nr:hypothetical protein [Candidatus Binatota bacterium]
MAALRQVAVVRQKRFLREDADGVAVGDAVPGTDIRDQRVASLQHVLVAGHPQVHDQKARACFTAAPIEIRKQSLVVRPHAREPHGIVERPAIRRRCRRRGARPQRVAPRPRYVASGPQETMQTKLVVGSPPSRGAVAPGANSRPERRVIHVDLRGVKQRFRGMCQLRIVKVVDEAEEHHDAGPHRGEMKATEHVIVAEARPLASHVVRRAAERLAQEVGQRLLLLDTVAVDDRVAEQQHVLGAVVARVAKPRGIGPVLPEVTVPVVVDLEARLHERQSAVAIDEVNPVAAHAICRVGRVRDRTGQEARERAERDLDDDRTEGDAEARRENRGPARLQASSAARSASW